MKTKIISDEPVTLEDIVFENRNKEYGAYSLNRQKSKYLLAAFFISLAFFSTTVAVPFINAYKSGGTRLYLDTDRIIILTDYDEKEANVLPPTPPPLPPPSVTKQALYAPPVIVEEPSGGDELAPMGEIIDDMTNKPVTELPAIIEPPAEEIDEPNPPFILFPEEQASFNNGDLNEFRKWVQEHVTYPQMAIDNKIFGKVIIEFCVNARGEVVDIKLIRGVDPSVDNETMKTISASPLWKPARQGGKPVKQRFTMPVMFTMLE